MFLARRSGWLWCGLAATVTYTPFLFHWNVIGSADFDQFATFNQIALWWHALGDYTVTWNPFLCGGATLAGNPQIPLLHPHMLLFAIFGPVNGLGVVILVWLVAGFVGMRALARDHGLRRDVSCWLATAWVANGFFAAHLGNMHGTFWAFFGLPALFLLHRRIARDSDAVARASYPFVLGMLGLYNFQFIAYALPFLALHFVLELSESAPRGARLSRGVGFAGVFLLGVAMTGASLLPGLAWNRDFPRFKAAQFVHPVDLAQMLVSPVAIFPFARDHRAHEYMSTLGPVLVALAMFGVGRGAVRKVRPIVAVSVVAFVTAVGTFEGLGLPAFGPFDLLRAYAPGYRALRVPSRFMIHALLGMLLLAGFGWQALLRPDRLGRTRRVALVGLALIPLLALEGVFMSRLFRSEEGRQRARSPSVTNDFSWAPSRFRRNAYRALEPNVGVLHCYDALEIPQAPALDPEAGFVLRSNVPLDVERHSWGEFELRLRRPSATERRVEMNFNHHRGWAVIASDGWADVTSSSREPLAVVFPPGTTRARLRHLDPAWPVGVGFSAVAAVLSAGLLVLARSKRRELPSITPKRIP